MANKAELLHFLDQNVFNPILHAKPHGHDAKDVQYVQDKTEAEQKRFHGYPSAEEIVKM